MEVSRCATRASISGTILSVESGTPIIPVDEGNTWFDFTLRARATARQICSQSARPEGPVAQLALPELTITARTRPRLERKDARPTCTGAAATRFVVKTAAAVVFGEHSTKPRSRPPLALMPTAREENANPRGRGIVFFAGSALLIPGALPA